MSFFGKRKSLIFLTALGISGVFLFSRINVKNALALHDAASYAKPVNGTLTSGNWNDLLSDFVNTWTTATMAGPLGIGVSTAPAAGLNVNGPIQGSSLFSLGSVGIGIASPISSRVQLYGNNTFDTALRFTNTGTNGGDYFILSSNSGWDAGGNKLLIGQGVPSSVNTKLVLTSDGNFGIATTSPAAKLGIASSTSRVINVGGGRIGGLDFTPINDDEAVSLNYLRSNYIPVGSTPGGIGAGTVGQTLRHNGTSWEASSLLYNNGTNIGIGTTSPTYKLQVAGNVAMNNAYFLNPGVGNDSILQFLKTSDQAWVSVKEVTNDNTLFGFYMADNPDGAGDEFFWQINDYKGRGGDWQPLRFTNLSADIRATNINAYGDYNVYGPWYSGVNGVPNTVYTVESGSLNPTINVSAYTGTTNVYWVKIDGTGTPNTFSWGRNSLSPIYGTTVATGVAITGGAQALENGVTVTFNTTTGGVMGDYWQFRVSKGGRLSVSNGSAAVPSLSFTGDTNTGLYLSGSDSLSFTTGGLERMRLSSNGNVGINTTTPTAKLAISSSTAVVINVGGGRVGGLDYTPLNDDEAVPLKYLKNNYTASSTLASSTFWMGSLSGNVYNANTGNVGIGTTSPLSKLNITGSSDGLKITGGGNNFIELRSSGNNALYIDFAPNSTSDSGYGTPDYPGRIIYNSVANSLQLLSGGKGITINSVGNVGIGTTNPGQKFDITNTGASATSFGFQVVGDNGSTGGSRAGFKLVDTTSTSGAYSFISRNSGFEMNQEFGPSYSNLFRLNGSNGNLSILGSITSSGTGNNSFVGSVGIGTTNPGKKLQIESGSVADGGLQLSHSNGTVYAKLTVVNPGTSNDTQFGTVTNNSLRFLTVNSERMRIDTAGNVGIGITNPSNKLAFNASTTEAKIGLNGGYVRGLTIVPVDDTDAASKGYIDDNFAPIGAAGNVFGTGTTNYLPKWTAAHTIANSLIYDNGTNVGIGTTSPSEKLEIVGKLKIGNNTVSGENMTFDGSTAGGMRVTNPYGYVNITPLNNGWAHMYTDRSNFIFNKSVYLHSGKLASYSTSDLYFSSGGSRIDMLINNTTGNVAIGTTTASTKLYVNGGTGNSINVNGGYVMGLNSTPVNADQAVPLGYLQANYAPTSTIAANSFWSGSLTGNVYNANTGNIGIGTTAPYDKLEVAGAIAATGSFGGNNNQGPATLMYYSTTGGYGGIQAVDWGANYKNLILNSFGGNVGIGTTNPNGLLEINGTGSANSMFRLITTGGGGFTLGAEDNTANPVWRIETNSSENFKFRIGGTDTMTLTPGFVGVGMTNPRTKAHIWTGEVSGGQQESLRLEGNWVSNPSGPLLRFTNQHDSGTNPNSGEYNLAGIQGVDDTSNWGGSLAFFTTPSGTAGGGNLAERMRITNNGNIGIGTTGPNSKLEVFGGAVNSGNSDIFTINTNSVSTGYYGSLVFRQSSSNIGARITSGNAGSYKGFLAFETSRQAAAGLVTSEAMRIDGAGNVGIGTTSPTSTLQVYGSGDVINVSLRSIGGLDLTPVNNDQAVPLGYLKANYGASTLWGGTTSGDIWSLNSGSVGIGTTSPQAKLHVVGSVRIGEQTRTNWPSDAPIYQTTLYGTAGDIPFRTASTSPMTMNLVYGPFGYANPSCDSSHAKWYRVYAEYVDNITSGGQAPMLRIDFSSGTDRDFTMPLTWGGVPNYRTYLSAPFQESNTNHAYIQTWINGTAGPYVEIRKVELWAYCL